MLLALCRVYPIMLTVLNMNQSKRRLCSNSSFRACCSTTWPQLLKPAHLEPVLHNKRSHHNAKPAHCN